MRGTQPRGGALRRLTALEAAMQPGGKQPPAVVIVRVQPGLIEALTAPEDGAAAALLPGAIPVVRVVLPDNGRGDA